MHAVHTPYRERSHFDGQDVLESGLAGVVRINDGWLNRALANAPHIQTKSHAAVALAQNVPLVLRGKAPVTRAPVPAANREGCR